MKEEQLINHTLNLLEDDDTRKAYEYLVENHDKVGAITGQTYNFLYCLAATSGKKDEAIAWMKEAILDKEMWYRPVVFEDEDLDSIRDHAMFKTCVSKSLERYELALEAAKSVLTWEDKTHDNLMLVLHGNQQNISICRQVWDKVETKSYQIEYLQSEELDSYDLYRWEEDGNGPSQLMKALNFTNWTSMIKEFWQDFQQGVTPFLEQ